MGVWKKLFSRVSVMIWILVIGSLLVFMGVRVVEKIRESEAHEAAIAQRKEREYSVEVRPVERSDWEVRRSYYGQVKSVNSQTVTSYVREMVQEVHVRPGDRVKKGQTLVTLSSQNYRLDAASVQANYEDARREYERLSALYKSGGVSKSQVELAQSRVKEEQANLQSSRTTRSRTAIKASVDGVVSSRMVEPGEVAEPGRALLTIVDVRDLEVDFMVSRRDIRSLSQGAVVEIVTHDGVERGEVKRVNPEAAPGSGLYPVLVALPRDSKVLPGTYLEGRFLVDERRGVIVIPSEIVQRRGEKAYVYVIDPKSSRAGMREIVPGEGQGGRLIVAEGLSDGDLLVTRGFNMLREGALVRISGTSLPGAETEEKAVN